jgi:hypothetical protein
MNDQHDDGINRRTAYTTVGGGSKAQGTSAKEAWERASPFAIADDITILKVGVEAACRCKRQLDAALIYASYGVPVIPCNWRPEKQPDGASKINKHPLIKAGVYGATDDTEQLRSWWGKWPKALIGVPGGRRTGVWFFDVDAKEAHAADGLSAWTRLEIDHDDATTRTHRTGTGGTHRLYRWDAGRPVGCPVSTVPAGMEVKGEGGYVIFPPSPYRLGDQTVAYSVVNDDHPLAAPAWLYDLILGPRKRAPKGNGAGAGGARYGEWEPGWVTKKLDYFCDLIRSAEIHHWDAATRKMWKFAKWVGGGAMDPDEAVEALEKAAKDNTTAPADYLDKVRRTFWNGVAQPEGPFGEDAGLLDDFYAYMPQHNYLYVPTREPWPGSSVNARIPSVDGKLKASTWLDQNRAIEQMTWAPGQGMLIRGRLIAEGGWIEKDGVTCFNLYRPPTIAPGDAAQAGPWLDHVYKVFGDDAEHIITWCAQRVQHPEIKINHALVLGSEKHGIGKDAALEPVKRSIGHWNFGDINPQQLLGRFNGFLKNVILRISEARDLGEITRYQFYDHTKMINAAPPDVLRVDEKFLREHSVVNCVGVIITTNYKANGIYLPAEDRRHYVAWSGLSPEDFSQEYWNKLFGWYDTGGDRHVAAYLAALDIAAFDPKAPPPKTQAFWDIVDANRAPEDSELADVLDGLGNPEAVTVRHIISGGASPEFARWLLDRKNWRLLPHRFAQCGYVPVRNPHNKQGFWKIGGQRQVVYALSTLSVRDQLAAAEKLRQSVDGPDRLL